MSGKKGAGAQKRCNLIKAKKASRYIIRYLPDVACDKAGIT
jgi:hypothetical protein